MRYFEVVSLLEERLGDLESVLATEAKLREEALAAIPAAGADRFARAGKAAIIPVRGILLDEWSMAGPRWGATGYNYIRAAVSEAGVDRQVKATVIDYDSPGGLVSGMQETADVIARNGIAATGKPIFSVIRSYGASACYALACNGDRVIAGPSSQVGSIGARLTHISVQKMIEDIGVEVTEISSHPGKAEFSPFRNLSDEAKARLQAGVDDAAAAFVQMVARRRNLTTEAVNKLNAEVFPTQSANGRMTSMAAGLVDAVGAADEVIAEILRQIN